MLEAQKNSSDIKFTYPLIQTYIQPQDVCQGQGHGQETPGAPAPGPLPRRPQGARHKVFPKYCELITWKRPREPTQQSPIPSQWGYCNIVKKG